MENEIGSFAHQAVTGLIVALILVFIMTVTGLVRNVGNLLITRTSFIAGQIATGEIDDLASSGCEVPIAGMYAVLVKNRDYVNSITGTIDGYTISSIDDLEAYFKYTGYLTAALDTVTGMYDITITGTR